ncbi:MAG: L-serine ammonia-lyase, iron-sulfur-dependent, subunit alpha [Bacteroidota bacterium]|nr:L-serine ammonia-lyase, iron-sulfur-dependent, subunit alpha [Rhodothermia bacterium]MDW8285918.1 L-serine ammonia-lyase, iron-sulfur-dependent, subunit alpha [Bacteroidota bacterium]
MPVFERFREWFVYCEREGIDLAESMVRYEMELKGRSREEIYARLDRALGVMEEAVQKGLEQQMRSRSGLLGDWGKRVARSRVSILGPQVTAVIARALAAKEVNACMGRIVAAPTAGSSGILPAMLTVLMQEHNIPRRRILDGLLVAAGIALIIERRAGIAGAVAGCQAETGSAAAMGAGAVVYLLGGSTEQIGNAVAIALQCLLGLICDPVAGLVEVPCVVRNASGALVGFAAAEMALAGVPSVIPVDEVVDVLAELGQAMDARYKETALGGLATTPTGRAIAQQVLIQDVPILGSDPSEGDPSPDTQSAP